MPLYGEMLSAFPELLADYQVFRMDPKPGGGYGKRHDVRTVRGYMSWRKGGKAGSEDRSANRNDLSTFWEQHDFVTGESGIEQLDYIEAKGKLLRFVEGDDLGHEGGFSRWLCQLVSTLDGTQKKDGRVNLGARDFV